MDPYLWNRLLRRPWLSLVSLILSGVLCFLLVFLTGYQQSQQTELAQIKSTYDILCVVTDRKGTTSSGLRQKDDAVKFVRDQSSTGLGQYIRDLRVTKEYKFSAPISEGFLIGVTSERCDNRLNSDAGAQVTYFIQDFYQQDGYFCIVSEQVYLQLAEEENSVDLFIQDPYIDPRYYSFYGTGTVTFEVAGYYAGTGSDIFISFETSQLLADEISGGLRSFDSMSFLAADNEQLAELKEAASSMFGDVDPILTWPKLALTVHDEQYRTTVAALEQDIQRTRYLLPLVQLLGLCAGFLISFLATQGERKTYALMRTLGMTKGRLFLSILREQLILTVLAVSLVSLLTGRAYAAVGYLICYSIGCCTAVIRSVRIPPTAILREQE